MPAETLPKTFTPSKLEEDYDHYRGLLQHGKSLIIDPEDELTVYYHRGKSPLYIIPKSGGWGFLKLTRQDVVQQAFFEPREEEDGSITTDERREAIEVNQGHFFAFFALPSWGKSRFFYYSDDGNAELAKVEKRYLSLLPPKFTDIADKLSLYNATRSTI